METNSTKHGKKFLDKFINKNETAQLRQQLHESLAKNEAIDKVQAVIEFNLDGTIITANDNFLTALGYRLDEIQGKHHSMFVEPELARSSEYQQFWNALNRGEYQTKEYKRIGKGGKEIWIQASYNPIFDMNNKPYKVVKYATDVTEHKLEHANFSSQINAIDKSQAVIEFNLDGTIITANDNFLTTLGYRLDEIQGKHHSIFVEAEFARSSEYQQFWEVLNRGEYQAAEYKRIGKGGKEVWIQASYNPIFDMNNKPYKVVKYATDITPQKELQETVEHILQQVSKVMLALSEGKLNERVGGQYSGDFAKLQNATNQYCNQLAEMVKNILQVGQLVNMGANEISQGNLDLSRRTETQAAALEETSASMEEITSTVKQNADNSKDANELAINARSQAQSGGEVVNNAVVAMGEINQASNKISNIISVIDEIAFQTNLLALNAAVEAARAGEQGRGFAVVATEVRNLAGRSASAAKEIKELIEDSVTKVEEGSRLVNQSGETLEEIMGSVKKVASIIGDITSASQEQALGIEQINKAIVEMDSTTQQNTALVEEAAAASESMSEQSNELSNLLSFFQLEGQEKLKQPLQPSATNDRRSSSRPWSGESAKPSVEKAQVDDLIQKVSGGDIDDDWQEF